MLTIADIAFQLFAAGLLLYGLHYMGSYRLRGPALAAVSEVLWVGVGLWHSLYGLIFLSVVLTIMQYRNFVRWYADNREW